MYITSLMINILTDNISLIVTIAIFIIVFYLTLEPEIIPEGLINISKMDKPSWNRNKCSFKINKTLKNVLSDIKLKKSKEANVYFPCGYNFIDDEIDQLPIKKDARYYIIHGADEITAKNKLWEHILEYHGLDKAITYAPETYVLSNLDDIERMKSKHRKNKLYIMKKNIQRQTGLKITDDLDYIINNKHNYVLAQDLLQDPYILNGRKINLRVYILTICYKNQMDVYVYNDGFMYYTKEPFKKGSKDKAHNITTGYIERWVYEVNPLTHQDFKKYLDDTKRSLCNEENIIRTNDQKISEYVFQNIIDLVKNIFIAMKPYVCKEGNKLSNNISYQLFGADVEINNKLKSKIIEINKGPDLNAKDARDSELKKRVVQDMFEILGMTNKKNNNGWVRVLDM